MGTSSVSVVLVPGLGLDERSSAELRQLVPGTVVLLPGMGLAGSVPPLDALAGRLLAALGEGPVVLVGHSQSCQWKHPVPLTARKLAASLWTGRRPPIRGCARPAAWCGTGSGRRRPNPGGRCGWCSPSGGAPGRGRWPRSGGWPPPTTPTGGCGTSTSPWSSSAGRGTRCAGAAWAARLAAAAPDGRLVEIPGAAHMTPQTHPAAVADLLRAL